MQPGHYDRHLAHARSHLLSGRERAPVSLGIGRPLWTTRERAPGRLPTTATEDESERTPAAAVNVSSSS